MSVMEASNCYVIKQRKLNQLLICTFHLTVCLNHIFVLFDCLIKPVLKYGCAVWGSGNSAAIEKCHLQFMKQTLKAEMTTNSCVVYAETGRYPLGVYINSA